MAFSELLPPQTARVPPPAVAAPQTAVLLLCHRRAADAPAFRLAFGAMPTRRLLGEFLLRRRHRRPVRQETESESARESERERARERE